MTIMDYIAEYVNGVELRVPIFTQDIFNFVKTRIPEVEKAVLNAYIGRYEKRTSNFIRYQKGIYYKTVKTPFGYAGIKYADLLRRFYLEDGKDVVGYETGPSYMNKIGLTTQMPTCTYLASKRDRATFSIEDKNLFLLKPVVDITRENFRYLQFLDILDNKMNVKIENEKYKEVLRKYIDNYELSFEKLLHYATYYSNNKIYKKLAELAR